LPGEPVHGDQTSLLALSIVLAPIIVVVVALIVVVVVGLGITLLGILFGLRVIFGWVLVGCWGKGNDHLHALGDLESSALHS